MHFEFPLAEERVKRKQVISLHLVVTFALIATGVFLLLVQYLIDHLPVAGQEGYQMALASYNGSGMLGMVSLGLGILLPVFLVLRKSWFSGKKTNQALRITELLLMVTLGTMAAVHGFMIPALIYAMITGAILFAIYWESITDNILYVHINEDGVRLPPTCRKKHLHWNEVEQVIYRFGILTIDCYDNRLFQWNIRETSFDKSDFNAFCTEHIARNKRSQKELAW